ncbi:hypothetical protein MOV76_39500, partial [Rhizobium sp. PRIMUS64]|nr:hypothetical protein [Rhizobium sp. PRIMUS64]
MRTPRSDGEAISDAARIRRAALLSADMLPAARWDGTAPLLADGSTLSPRLYRRLFTEIAEAHGDPATFADGARRLISMDAGGRATAALR